MIRLIAKEISQLRHIGYLWLSVIFIGYFVRIFTERVDEITFGGWCVGYCDVNADISFAIAIIALTLVTAYSLFPKEHDESTIDFLRALPVSRVGIFTSKVVAAWLLMATLAVLSYGIDWLMLASNPESMGGIFYTQVWLTLLWRDCLFIFVVLCHGIFLSWFRTLGLMLYVLYLVLLVLAETYLGTSGHWNIFTLMSNEYSGSKLLVNSEALIIHAVVALFILFLSYRLWNRTESGKSGQKKASKKYRFTQIFLACIGFIAFSGVAMLQIQAGTGSDPDTDLKVNETAHYRFVYSDANADVVDYIVEHAEADLWMLADLMGVVDVPRIRVDLTAESDHAIGLAKWKKIQIDLDGFDSDISQRRVLAHETTHVLQATESKRAMADNYNAVKFFIEGMAQYTSFVVVPETVRRQSNWELASVAWKRQDIKFVHLIDAVSFSQRYDAELHYSLGDVWTSEFASVCGQASLGEFLRAMGREDAPNAIAAIIFWRDTMNVIDCDLDAVNAAWRKEMLRIYNGVDRVNFPKFKDIVVSRDELSGSIKLMVSLKADSSDEVLADTDIPVLSESESRGGKGYTTPDDFAIRIANTTNTLAASTDHVFRGRVIRKDNVDKVEFIIPGYVVPGVRFRYQLGYAPSPESRYYYDSWRRGSIGLSSQL